MIGVMVLVMAALGGMAYAQGGATTSSLSGTVVDASGGVIPGADVVAKNNATAGEFRSVSNATGAFTLLSMPPGTYTVTVSLMGFKTVTMPDVQLIAAQPSRVKAVLEVGQLQETVVVTGATEIVQTETAAVATTLSTKQINTVPLATRNTLDFVAALPGVNTTTSIRGATVMGLQASATNITIDGINVQDNYLKSSDGFFSRISPRMDAVEEVTVSTANPGAESAGQGAVQIRFVTRSGTNKFQGSAYEYMRRTSFNSNYWFNQRDGLPKDEVKVDTFGGRIGGPIKKDKLFFFFNYEEFRQPGTQSRSRTVLTARSERGDLQVQRWAGPREPVGAGGGERADVDARHADGEVAGRPAGGSGDRHDALDRQPDHADAELLQRLRSDSPVSDDARRLQRDAESPRGRVVLLAAVPVDARHAEHLRLAVPRLPERGRPELGPVVGDGQLALEHLGEHGQ